MLLDELTIAGSAFAAQVLTSLDNMALLAVLVVANGRMRVISGYLLSQAVVLLAALGFGGGADLLSQGRIGWLGLVPLLLGLRGVWLQYCAAGVGETRQSAVERHVLGYAVVFLAMSFDSFSVIAPLLADSRSAYRTWILAGAGLAVAGVAAGAGMMSRTRGASSGWLMRLERLGPVVMMLAGLYVLWNSATDQI